MKILSSTFAASAYKPEEEPRLPGPIVAFLGRSNVGKSSMINRLLGVKDLARTSSTPGRTQSVNFYRINDAYWFVDLPGYGYARVPEAVRKTWGPRIESFLERHRSRIAVALVLVDLRHGATELDLIMSDWLEARGIPYVVAATKADKLSGNERTRAAAELRRALAAEGKAAEPVAVSSKTGAGLGEIWTRLDAALGARPGRGRREWTSAN